jgi:hypothetical protein
MAGRIRLESVAALPWNGRQLSSGISGRIRLESVAGLPWNQWQLSRRIRSWSMDWRSSGDKRLKTVSKSSTCTFEQM